MKTSAHAAGSDLNHFQSSKAVVVFYDHRGAGLIYQAIQCGALELSKEADRIYVKFLQAQECQKASLNMRCCCRG